MYNNSADLASRITQIESRLQELKSIGTPGNYGAGGVLFGGGNGKAAIDGTNFVWDNTNKRLGIGTNAPGAKLHIKFTGGSITGLRVESVSASADTLLDIYNSDNSISSGSNWRLTRSAATTYEQLRGDGFYGVYGPVNISDNGFAVPAKTQLHVRSVNYYGIRVTASTAGGAYIQSPLSTNSSFARAWFGHNAIWNDSDSLWYIDNIGANDAQGVFVANGGPMEFILHASTGASARTMNMATFRGGAQMTINNAGLVNLAGGGPLQISGTQVLTTRRTGYTFAWTGTSNRATAYDPSTITLVQLAQRVKAIQEDLTTHGIIGA